MPQSPLGEIWTAATGNGLVALDLWQDEDRFHELVTKLKEGEQVYEPHAPNYSLPSRPGLRRPSAQLFSPGRVGNQGLAAAP